MDELQAWVVAPDKSLSSKELLGKPTVLSTGERFILWIVLFMFWTKKMHFIWVSMYLAQKL